MTLEKYKKLGGKLHRLNFDACASTYVDNNKNLSIVKIEHDFECKPNEDLYYVTFENGRKDRYAGMWIIVTAELILDSKYTQ